MAKHVVYIELAIEMREMDGTPDESAEIAFDQVTAALAGNVSEYGLPHEAVATVCDVVSDEEVSPLV
jgi:hypothetical protein